MRGECIGIVWNSHIVEWNKRSRSNEPLNHPLRDTVSCHIHHFETTTNAYAYAYLTSQQTTHTPLHPSSPSYHWTILTVHKQDPVKQLHSYYPSWNGFSKGEEEKSKCN